MKGATLLLIIADGLPRITLPAITRPTLPPTDSPTEELVDFGIQYYAFSLIAHLRTILRALVLLSDAENTPAAYIVSRHVYEWAAHACFMSRNLAEHHQKKQWKEAWELLSHAAIGNLWARRHGEKYISAGMQPAVLDDIPDPVHISKAMTAYEEHQQEMLGKRDAKDSYGLLSEYSHPNSACFRQHHRYDRDGRTVRFVDAGPQASPLPLVNWCLIDLVTFLHSLLGMSKEKNVRAEILTLIHQIVAIAPKT